MECIEARALKSSFLSQMANTQAFQNDDVWCLTKISSVAADDFPVEDLLNLNPDLPEKESQQGLSFSQEDHQLPQQELSNNSSFTFTGAGEFDSLSQPALPVDDLENLEWLSQFVDDSTCGLSLLCPAQSFESGSNSGEPQKLRSPRFPLPVHVKARSTRSKEPRGRPWTLASPPSPAARLFSTPSFSHTSSPFLLAIPVQGTEWLPISEKPPAKRRKRRAVLDGVSGRRCTHCQVQKTPQWRTGPIGPKTLCNACGVRYKSGRLFPEYRPAFSPTFSHGQHSNSHRKVVELRRKKESEEMVVGPGFEQVLMGDSLSRFI